MTFPFTFPIKFRLPFSSSPCVLHSQPIPLGTAVSKVTGLGDEGHGVQIPEGIAGFLSSKAFKPSRGSHSFLCQWVQWALSLKINRPGREADNSCPLRTGRATCTPRMLLRPVRWRIYVTSTWRWAHSRNCKPCVFIQNLTSNPTKHKTHNIPIT
jgi:hypothetical protein